MYLVGAADDVGRAGVERGSGRFKFTAAKRRNEEYL